MQEIFSTPEFAFMAKLHQQQTREIVCAIEREINGAEPAIAIIKKDEREIGKNLIVRIYFHPDIQTLTCLENYYVGTLKWSGIEHKQDGYNKIILYKHY